VLTVSFLRDLNPAQQDAVRAVNGPVMIIAGAGSGKTRVLTYRIAHLISCGVPPSSILALTFTNKAAQEMKQRIGVLAGDTARDLWMGTFHSMFARILRRESTHLGYTPSYSIYDSDDSLGAVKRSMERLRIATQQYHPTAIRSRISFCKNQMITPSAAQERSKDIFDEQAARVYSEYIRLLKSSNAMDFDDLLVKPIELFEAHPEILGKYQHRFTFLLVDEFQDTNRAQYKVMQLLGEKYRNICVVGDDAQSIYSFRGADVRNILDFTKDYPNCQSFKLEQNYRSTKSIIGVADALIQNNTNRLQKQVLFRKISAHFDGQLSGRVIALWGLAFKPNTDDMREAPSRTLMEALWAAGASVRAYDPVAMEETGRLYPKQAGLVLCTSGDETLEGADALAICTEWQEFRSPDFDTLKARLKTPVIFDGRNLYDPEYLRGLGLTYYAIGRGERLPV